MVWATHLEVLVNKIAYFLRIGIEIGTFWLPDPSIPTVLHTGNAGTISVSSRTWSWYLIRTLTARDGQGPTVCAVTVSRGAGMTLGSVGWIM